MGHICFWDRTKLEYDGLCSHPATNESVYGDFMFELSPDELDALEADRIEKYKLRIHKN